MRNNCESNKEEIGSETKSTTGDKAYSVVGNQKIEESDKIENKRPSDVIEAFLTYLFL